MFTPRDCHDTAGELGDTPVWRHVAPWTACLQDTIIDEFAAKTERSHIIKHFGARVHIYDNAFTGFLDISMENLKTQVLG